MLYPKSARRITIQFIKDNSTGIEVISVEKSKHKYPPHTHTGHYVIGIVTEGAIKIMIGEKIFYCKEGEYFTVAPDVCHSIENAQDFYSMISICIPDTEEKKHNLEIIRNSILGNPELEMSLADFSEKANVSKFHMIRKFADENGITPHKFQVQCRIRKAQKLLEEGMKVIEVAQEVGFCDQSHLDRAFKKQLGISPEEYSKSAILSKEK